MIANRKIVHVEIPSANLVESQNFYSAFCGWQFTNHEGEVPYSGSNTPNVGVGLPMIDNEMNHAGIVIIYLESEDIEADLREVESLGGTVVLPYTPVPGFGSFAIFKDPSGNPIGFWKDLE